jgi:hypothetical protein
VRQVANEWAAMTSELIPETLREKAANQTIPTRYLAPLVKEMEKLPPSTRPPLKTEVELNPNLDTLKQVTVEARYLSKYLASANQVQLLETDSVDLELALEEALRVGCLNAAADMVAQAAQLEQTAAKLYTTWKRLHQLAERVYLDSGREHPPAASRCWRPWLRSPRSPFSAAGGGQQRHRPDDSLAVDRRGDLELPWPAPPSTSTTRPPPRWIPECSEAMLPWLGDWVWQPRQSQPCLRLAGGGGGKDGADQTGGSHQRQPRGGDLHQRRHGG